jgi:hypothetical protein
MEAKWEVKGLIEKVHFSKGSLFGQMNKTD